MTAFSREPRDTSPESPGQTAIKGGAVRLAGYIAGIGLGMVSTMLLVRHLGVVDYGRYMTVVSLVAIVYGFSEAGLTRLLVRETALAGPSAVTPPMRNLFGMRMTLTTLGILVVLGVTCAARYDAVQMWGLVLGCLALLLSAVTETFATSLEAELRLPWLAALELVRQLVTVLMVTFLVLASAGLLPFFAIPIPAALAVLLFILLVVRGVPIFRPSFRWSEWRRLFRMAGPFAAATLLGAISMNVTVVLLAALSSAVETGYFSATLRILMALTAVTGLAMQSFFPVLVRMANQDTQRFASGVQDLFDASLLLGAWVAVGTYLGADLAIRIIAGAGFEPSAAVLRVHGCTVALAFIGLGWAHALLSLGRTKALLAASAAALATQVLVALAVMPTWGALGAAWAMLAGQLALMTVLGHRLMGPRPQLRVSLRYLPRIALAAACGLAVMFIPGMADIVTVILMSVVYFTIAAATQTIPDAVYRAFLPWRRSS